MESFGEEMEVILLQSSGCCPSACLWSLPGPVTPVNLEILTWSPGSHLREGGTLAILQTYTNAV